MIFQKFQLKFDVFVVVDFHIFLTVDAHVFGVAEGDVVVLSALEVSSTDSS